MDTRMTDEDPSLSSPGGGSRAGRGRARNRAAAFAAISTGSITPRAARPSSSATSPSAGCAILAVSVAYVLFRGRGELRDTWDQLQNADLTWIGIAIVIQFFMLICSGLVYKVILKRLGYTVPLPMMINAHMQRTTIATVTPGGGPASVFIFARFVAKRGVPAEDGLLTIAVRSLAVTITFIAVLIPGAAIDDSPQGMIIAGAGVAALVIGGIALWRGNANNWKTPLGLVRAPSQVGQRAASRDSSSPSATTV